MTFDEAGRVVIPFGKFKGETIEHAARTDEGLLWLDWAVDKVTSPRVLEAMQVYLDDPSIKSEVARAVEDCR